MSLIIDGQQLVRREMRVFLRGVERRVAQHFLNGAQIGAFVKKVSGKRMPERMRAHGSAEKTTGIFCHDSRH